MVDLHMHSTASDGMDGPAELMRKCTLAGLEMCAVTDHDNVDAQYIAQRTAKEYNLGYITGVELSAQYTGELHILGLGYNLLDEAFVARMEELRSFRVERTEEIIAKLAAQGIELERRDVERHAAGNTLGRPHVALALVEKGYARDFGDAFRRYLREGQPGYVNRRKLGTLDAISLIHSAGGTAVLAHPGLIQTDDFPALLRRLVHEGLDGIEAFYPEHSDAQAAEFLRLARTHNLLVTSGSDYHGYTRCNKIGCEQRESPELQRSVRWLRDRYAGA